MENQIIFHEKIIIRLIRDHLINMKLISGLNKLGLNADDYNLYLGDTIFMLLDLETSEQSDMIFEKVFLGNSEKIIEIDFSSNTEDLDKLSEMIYKELIYVKSIL